jgi:transposase
LAHIAISKYQDALPLYRQEAIFARHGIELSRTTLANWLIAVADRLTPMLSIMRRDLLSTDVLHSDETTLQVLKEPGRCADQRSYLWLNVTATGPPIVLYHYAPSRSRAVVEQLLGGYRGTLVTDGYAAYDAVAARHAGCWAHARRKFHEAFKAQPGARTGKAQVGFNFIQKLFVLERTWQDLNAATRQQRRQLEARPLLAELKDWLDTSLVQVAPKTLTGKALGYLANQWSKLTVFLDDGDIPIHNNLAENKIRPFVIGRKNWLFSDTVAGAHTSAALYSLIETAKANDLDPMIYLHWLFAALPRIDPDDVGAITTLLPYRVDRDRIAADLAREYDPTPAVR